MTGHSIHKAVLLITSAILLFLLACVKERIDTAKINDSPEFKADIAAPIGFLNLNIRSFVRDPDAVVRPNADKIVTLFYSDSVTSPKAGSLFRIDPIMYAIDLVNETGNPIDLSSGGFSEELDLMLPLTINDDGADTQIDSLTVLKGEIRAINPDLPLQGQSVKLVFPETRKNNQPVFIQLDNTGNALTQSLDGSLIRIIKEGDSGNMVPCHLSLSIPEQSRIVEPGDLLAKFDLLFTVDQWGLLFGYSSGRTFDLPLRSFNITYDTELPGGEYSFSNPQLLISSDNSYGLPVGLGFRTFSIFTRDLGIQEVSGTTFPRVPDYLFLKYSASPESLIPEHDVTVFDKTNSNMVSLISNVARTIIYQPVLKISGDNQASGNFISASSKLDIKVELQLPFSGYAGYIGLSDTMTFNPSDFNIPMKEDVTRVIFNVYFENSFPADMDVQLFLTDENLNITDTLFTRPVAISGADPTEFWQEIPPEKTGSVYSEVSPDIIPILKRTKYIIATGKFNTINPNTIVNIFDNQALLLKMGVIFTIDTGTGSN